MDLLFIRHAESFNNAQESVERAERRRQADPDLTDRGRMQAQALADAFVQGRYPRPTHLYSSLMLRAVATAAPIAAALDLKTVGRLDSFEVYGPVEFADGAMWGDGLHTARAHPGSSRADLLAANASLLLPDQAGDDGWWPGPVESDEAIAARAGALLADLQDTHEDGDTVALVSHGTFGHVFLNTVLGVVAPQVFLMLGNTSVTYVSGLGKPPAEQRPSLYPSTVLHYLGRQAHLKGLPA